MYPWVEKRIKEIEACSPDSAGLKERRERHLQQYADLGYCEVDMWSLDIPIAKSILPMLKAFYENTVIQDTCNNYGPKKNYEIMIWAFEKIANDDARWVSKEDAKKIQKGLNLFAKNLLYMWC